MSLTTVSEGFSASTTNVVNKPPPQTKIRVPSLQVASAAFFYFQHCTENNLSRIKKPISKASWQASKTAYHVADKGFTTIAKWATADHSGFGQTMNDMPKMGFIATCKYIALRFVLAIIGAVLSGALVFILIAFGIPLFIQLLLT